MALIEVPAPLLAQLRDEIWSRLSDADRRKCIADLTPAFRSAGFVPESEPERRVGPAEDARVAFDWLQPASGVRFTLVPGGRFTPGLAPERIQRLRDLHAQADATFPEGVLEMIVQAAPVEIGPFLLGTFPDAGPKAPARVRPDGIDVARAVFGWRLPSPHELEWAANAGRGELFPWGDCIVPELELADIDQDALDGFADQVLNASAQTFVPEERWPTASRFGIVGIAGAQQWCWLEGAKLLLTHGGSADCYPWQNPADWLLMLNSLFFGAGPEEATHGAVLRPAVSLG